MKSFIVKRKEVYIQGYQIKATNKEQALAKVKDGKGILIAGIFEYYYPLDDETWEVEEEKDG